MLSTCPVSRYTTRLCLAVAVSGLLLAVGIQELTGQERADTVLSELGSLLDDPERFVAHEIVVRGAVLQPGPGQDQEVGNRPLTYIQGARGHALLVHSLDNSVEAGTIVEIRGLLEVDPLGQVSLRATASEMIEEPESESESMETGLAEISVNAALTTEPAGPSNWALILFGVGGGLLGLAVSWRLALRGSDADSMTVLSGASNASDHAVDQGESAATAADVSATLPFGEERTLPLDSNSRI